VKKLVALRGEIALVSDKDFAYLKRFNWWRHKKGYFIGSTGEVRKLRLHRVIAARMGLDSSNHIDHKNRNKADNQRRNLRPATNGQNRANSTRNKNNRSGYKGVHLKKGFNKWIAQINVNGRKVYLGQFDKPQQAHEAYKRAAKFHFGKFANP
jgi:hypothetical protein